MRAEYDPEADACYIYLREIESGGVGQTLQTENPCINLDLDHFGVLVGIEVLGASALLPAEMWFREARLREVLAPVLRDSQASVTWPTPTAQKAPE